MIRHMLMSRFERFDSKQKNTESTEIRKNSFPKEIVEHADQHKSVLSKIITTQE